MSKPNNTNKYYIEKPNYVDVSKTQIFVFCSAKTGSTHLHNLFSKKYNSLHVHGNSGYRRRKGSTDLKDLILHCSNTQEEIYVIDSYREPIERKIASFWQNISTHVPNWNEIEAEELIQIFNDKYIYRIEEYHSYKESFDYFNIPYIESFDFSKQFYSTKHNNITFIKLRLKDSKNWVNILNNNFNFGLSEMDKISNNATNKPYSKKYAEFNEKYRVPVKFLESLKNDREFFIFNTDEEREIYLEKWYEKSY